MARNVKVGFARGLLATIDFFSSDILGSTSPIRRYNGTEDQGIEPDALYGVAYSIGALISIPTTIAAAGVIGSTLVSMYN